MMNDYSDIIKLEHPTSKVHKRMSIEARSAQFAPFSALTGFSEEIDEVKRITYDRIILSDEAKERISNTLTYINNHIKDNLYLKVKYFVPDNKKNGGSYKEVLGFIKKIDTFNNIIVFTNLKKIKIDDIVLISVC